MLLKVLVRLLPFSFFLSFVTGHTSFSDNSIMLDTFNGADDGVVTAEFS